MIDLFDQHQITQAKSECNHELSLTFVGISFRISADCPAILEYLEKYFSGLTLDENAAIEKHLFLINRKANTSGGEWTPVKRIKASPLGLKEAYIDTPEGRWIHKVRTGMVMFQSLEEPIAVGDLHRNRAQVVNFINNQFLNHYQQEGFMLGHAAAFDINGNTTAIAASSGGGKSTLMLHALENAKARFLSNDRVLFRNENDQIRVLGLAKHPRVNPGTLVNSRRLVNILSEDERQKFEAMPRNELWDIEQKYDAIIPDAYGEEKTTLSGHLKHLVLLDWSLEDTKPTQLCPVDLQKTPEALEGLRKSPGPFFQKADGTFPKEKSASAEVYAAHLHGVQVWSLTGAVDFDEAITLMGERGIL